jgi:hypothetical protein
MMVEECWNGGRNDARNDGNGGKTECWNVVGMMDGMME